MKTCRTRLMFIVLVLAGSFGPGKFGAGASLEVSASVRIGAATDFYEPLAPNGAWVEVGGYGRCWHPAGVTVEWHPYCDGTWVWTDCGWYWESDEPWAWACYHYGSWVYDPDYGWVWVPGVEWAPAWVYWRIGGDYIGWAPCSPRSVAVNSSAFVFVDERHFHEHHRPATLMKNNLTIINQTRQVTGGVRESRKINGRKQTVVVNRGPDLNVVEKATGKKFAAISVQEADRHTIVPPAVRRRNTESPGQLKAPVVQEPVKTVPEHNLPLPAGETHEHPVKPVPSDINLPPPKHEVAPPSSKQKIVPPQPPPRPDGPPPGTEERNDQGQGGERDPDKGH